MRVGIGVLHCIYNPLIDVNFSGISLITFHANDFVRWGEPVNTPTIIFVVGASLKEHSYDHSNITI